MAKQVAELTVNLDIKGYEKLESLKGAFKGLQAAIAPATQDIDLARAAILRFGETNTTTVRLVQAQVNGLKNLREQVDINGDRYRQLGADIEQLQAKITASNTQIVKQTTVLERGSRVFGVNIDTLKRYTAGLESTRTVLNKTATSVDTTTAAVNKLGDAISKTQSLKLDVGAGTPGGPLAGTRNAIQQTIALFQRLGEQSRTAVGQVGRVTEGIAATAGVSLLGKFGAGAAAGAAGLGVGGLSDIAGRITGLEQFLNRMPGAAGSKVLGGLTEPLMARVQELTALQGKMTALQATSDSFVSAFSQISPAASAATVAVAASFAVLKDQVDKQLNGLAADFEQSFTAMSDDVQRVLVALTRLGDQLGRLSKYEIGQLYGQAMQGFQAVPAGSPRSRSFASQLAGLGQLNERETAAQLDVLEEYRLRVAGAETSVNSLGARLGYLNDRLKYVNTSTTEGKTRYAEIRSEIVNTQKQIDALARSYTNVADAANRAADTQSSAASRAVTANYLNRAQVRQQEAAFRAAASEALRQAQATPLMLPAAGQTSALGTGARISGGAIENYRLANTANVTRFVEIPGSVGSTSAQRSAAYRQGLAGAGPSAADAAASDAARRTYISETAALRAKAEAEAAAKERLRELRQNVETLNKSNSDSIEKLQRLRQSWTELRDAVRMTSASYKNAQTQIDEIDRRLERANRPRRPTGMQLAQAAGAAISGGIFGGFEGFAGGTIGGIIGAGTPAGPVGGAFAGAAIGAQVGMIRQQVGAMTTYASDIRRLQIALQGVVASFDDYRTAIRTTEEVANRFNIPLKDSTQSFTQLSAAVVGSGGTINQAKDAFNNITAAILATGGSSEQVNAALTATAQVFSKGKVTAEELRGQLGERLPGAFALFAQSMGVSTQQLDKLMEQGKVGIPNFVRFIALLGTKYNETADRMAKSSEQAGARMTRAFENMQITVGNALGPTGAMFQDFFTNIINLADKAIKKLIQFNVLKPGPGYEISQVIAGTKTESELQREYNQLRTAQQLSNFRDREYEQSLRNPRVVRSASGGTTTTAMPDQRESAGVIRAREDRMRVLEDALTRLGIIRAATDADKGAATAQQQQQQAEEDARKREQRAQQYLDAIQQREESLLDARQDREEQLAEIRKNSLREAEQLERRFADERRQIEREVRDIRTQSADETEDFQRRLRIIRGEDPDVVNVAQRVADISRRERDANKAMSDRIADAERTQAQTIADFQRKTAEDIGKANEAYAKRVGEIQRKFAQEVVKISDEGSKRQAERMALAAQLVSLQKSRAAVADVLLAPSSYVGSSPRYGLEGRFTPEYIAGEYAANKPNRVAILAAIARDKQIGLITERIAQLDSQRAPAVGAPVQPATPAPNLTGRAPALPGAAATTAARTELSEAQRVASARRRMQEFQAIIEGSTTELVSAASDISRRGVTSMFSRDYASRGLTPDNVDMMIDKYVQVTRASRQLEDALVSTRNQLYEMLKAGEINQEDYEIGFNNLKAYYDQQKQYLQIVYDDQVKLNLEIERQNELLRFRQDTRIYGGAIDGLREYIATMGTAREASKQLATSGIKGVENAIVELATTGTANFREFANSMIQDTLRMVVQQFVLRSLLGMLNLGQPAAIPKPIATTEIDKYSANLLSPYTPVAPTYPQRAQGGITEGPMSGYPAILHGTEAVIPLTASRTIPVQLTGGGGAGAAPIININVDASGTSVQGDQGSSRELARDLAAVVDDRLVYHRRRGGLLDPQR